MPLRPLPLLHIPSSLVLDLDGAESAPHLEPPSVALAAAAAPVDLGDDDAARRRQVRRPAHLPPRARRLRPGTRVPERFEVVQMDLTPEIAADVMTNEAGASRS